MKLMKTSIFLPLVLIMANLYYGQNHNEFHIDQSYPINNTGTLYLSLHDADVTIIGENRQDVALKLDYFVSRKGIEWGNKEFYVEVDPKDGDLYIEEFREGSITIMGYSSTEYKVVIKVPNGVTLNIKGDDDDYNITAINGEISIDADDADVLLKHCQGNSFYFDLDDGDVIMDEGRGSLTARMDDGDIEISNAAFDNIDFRGDDGELALETSITPNSLFKLIGDDANFDIVITNGGGTFTIKHDDGDIDYDNNFRLMEQEEHRTVLALTGGRGKVIISGDDIRVNLASTQSN